MSVDVQAASHLLWKVEPWPTDDPDQWEPKDCACYCGATPDRVIARGESEWYSCAGCAPRWGWSLRWPTRRARRRLRAAE